MRTVLRLSDHPRAAEAARRIRPQLEQDLSDAGLRLGDPIFIRAFKEEKALELHVLNRASGKYDLFRTYDVAGASGELGPKLAGVPLIIPLAWTWMAWPAWLAAVRLTGGNTATAGGAATANGSGSTAGGG